MKHHTLVKQEKTGDKKAAMMEEKISARQEDGLQVSWPNSNFPGWREGSPGKKIDWGSRMNNHE